MRMFKYVAALMLLFTLCSAFSLKKKGVKQVYVMGVSFSFKDSVVYMTDIQAMPGVKLTKERFLPHRDEYSYQLNSYLEGLDGRRDHTCVTYFSTDRVKLQKKAAAVTKRFLNGDASEVRTLDGDSFRFTVPEEPEEE